MMRRLNKIIKAEQFDTFFDEGKSVVQYLDTKKAKIYHCGQRVSIDLPKAVIKKVDKEASRIGLPPAFLFKMWIVERVERLPVS